MIPVLMITWHRRVARHRPTSSLDAHLQARRRCAGECGDQVDVAVLARPFVALCREFGHRRIADRSRQRRAVGDHVVEERLVTADAFGDHAQESPLQVGDRVVEAVAARR